MDTLITTDLATRLWLLLHSCGLELLVLMLKASALLIICLWCNSQLQRSSAEIRHLSWLCFFFALALLPLLSQLLPVVEFSISSYPAMPIHEQLQQLLNPASANAEIINTRSFPTLANTYNNTINADSYSFSTMAILAIGYIVIVSVKLCRFALAIYQLRGLTHRASYAFELNSIASHMQQSKTRLQHLFSSKRRIKVYISHEVSSAMTWRTLKPCILLPYQSYRWDEQTIKSVIAHELAHIKRNDWLSLSFAKLVSIIFFPVPGLHQAFLQTSLEAESSADNQVITQCQSTIDYAQSLVQLAKSTQTGISQQDKAALNSGRVSEVIKTNEFALSYAVGIKGNSELGTRISRIIEPIAIRTPIHFSHKLSSLFFTVCFVAPLAVLQPAAKLFDNTAIAMPVVFADKTHNTSQQAETRLQETPTTLASDQRLNSIAELIHPARLNTPPDISPISEPEFSEQNPSLALQAISAEPQAIFHQAVYDIELPSHETIAISSNTSKDATPRTAVVITTVIPKYPKRALRNGIEGEVHAVYSVDENGQASDIVIVSSTPKIIFDKAVITAIKNSRFVSSGDQSLANAAANNPNQGIEKALFEQTYLFRLSDDKQRFAQLSSEKLSKQSLGFKRINSS